MYTSLNKKDFEVILDVLTVYDPNDINHVYPEMGSKEFLDGVQEAFKKVLKVVKLNKQCQDLGVSLPPQYSNAEKAFHEE